jgi:hypothetical protein
MLTGFFDSHRGFPLNIQGYVYVKFATVPASLLAAKTLDGRYFAKRQLSVEFLAEVVYNQMFPEAS